MSTSLSDIINAASVAGDTILASVTWEKPEYVDESQKDGSVSRKKFDTTEYRFDVHIVRQLSYGATERIMRASAMPHVSIGAVIVSEAVRFGDKGKERMDYDTANNLHPGLIMALREEVGKYHKGVVGADDDTPEEDEAGEADAPLEGDTKKPN